MSEDFVNVRENIPTKRIGTLLVANRGEIARRVIRTAREMGIRTVAVYSEIDRHSPHVRDADMHVALGGAAASESYLDQGKILRAALDSGADAIHPGYGFLSENADFAEACHQLGLIFVGPSPEHIRSMGLKDHAKDLAEAAGVPILPDARLDNDHNDHDAWLKSAASIGYPLLVKAVAGGGGKGMRIVNGEDDLVEAITGAKREALSAFGDGTVFLEKYLAAPRHVEIQVFGDQFGNAVHLLERECSVQRRHQKIIEEAPSPAVDPRTREAMGSTAVALVRKLGYLGAGTVEFLLDDSKAPTEFFFLEMNTRLQVEHPVTEAITGLDLVRLQIDVAKGLPLPIAQSDVSPDGHAIEVRLYAENANNDFLPTPGPMRNYEHGRTPGVRFDDGIGTNADISAFYDPMIAKITAHASSRDEAAMRLASALGELHLHGTITNRDYLVGILSDPDFLAGETHTDFVDKHPALLNRRLSDADTVRHLAAAVAVSVARRESARPQRSTPTPGWRLLPGHSPGRSRWQQKDGDLIEVTYRQSSSAGSGLLFLSILGAEHSFRFDDLTTNAVTLVHADSGVGTHLSVSAGYPEIYVNDAQWQSSWTPLPRLPEPATGTTASDPVSELPGTVVAVLVQPGDRVVAGQKLVVMEAMKMEHPTVANLDGIIEAVHVQVGQYIEAHTILVSISNEEA